MVENLDPYTELGILDRSSPEAVIKTAYRSASKATHPDAPGGSDEAFGRVKLAYEILMDKARRAKFDNTGEIDPTQPDNTETSALAEINRLLSIALMDDVEPEQNDIAYCMREGLKHIIADMEAERRKLTRAVKRAERMAKMFVNTRGNENIFPTSLEWHIRQIEAMQKKLDETLPAKRRALEILKDYKFERFQTAIEGARASGGSGTNIGLGFGNTTGRPS